MDYDRVSLSITPFQSTLKHILYTAASSGTTSGRSHATSSQTLHLASHCRQQQLCSFSKLCHFTYVTAHSDSPSFPSLHLRHSSFFPSLALPTSQLILQPYSCFTCVTAHSPTLTSLYLRHNSFSNPSVASPTSQLILQPFFRFSYVTRLSLTSPGEPTM